jgi:hypothetical protein
VPALPSPIFDIPSAQAGGHLNMHAIESGKLRAMRELFGAD